MPTGPAHLHSFWGDDHTAWMYLKRRGFTHDRGIIMPPWRKHRLTLIEEMAVDYLFMEWDWAYAPTRATETPPGGPLVHRARRWLSRASSGPLRRVDKDLGQLRMWWYCHAKYELRRRWAKLRGQPWDEDFEL